MLPAPVSAARELDVDAAPAPQPAARVGAPARAAALRRRVGRLPRRSICEGGLGVGRLLHNAGSGRETCRHPERFPQRGPLRGEKDWLLSPDPFPIEKKFLAELDQLGHRLFVFQRACNQLYQQSIRGKQPEWVARYLDAGKPKELIEFSRRKEIRENLPRVIRPDLILTDTGYTIAEIDSVPGGNRPDRLAQRNLFEIRHRDHRRRGRNARWISERASKRWRHRHFTRSGDLSAGDGMDRRALEGRAPSRPGTAQRPSLQQQWRVVAAENYEPQDDRAVYRFFELFDVPNIPNIDNTLRASAEGRITITPPIKPYLEEKMWFALFWMQPLREFWRRELGEKYFIKLQEVIPYSWLLDPTPLPQHAVIPRLEIHDWREAAKFSQKDRDLLLKVSGFSPLGWGSRGITLGSDLAHAEWEKRIDNALATFESSPTIMQRFHKGKLFEHRYWDDGGSAAPSGDADKNAASPPNFNIEQGTARSTLKTMKGRVRLCPYFFVEADRVKLHGALATIAPADKKFVHGMRDAILVPSRRENGDVRPVTI